MLKPKSRQVLDKLAGDAKLSATEAYLQVHKTTNRRSATSNAYKLLRKPEAQIYLQKHVDNARSSIVKLSKEAKNEGVRLSASQDILNREYGTATQRQEVKTQVVTLNLNLSDIVNE